MLAFDEPSTFGLEIIFIPLGLGFLASGVAKEIRATKHAAHQIVARERREREMQDKG